jgi:hypothetical protein
MSRTGAAFSSVFGAGGIVKRNLLAIGVAVTTMIGLSVVGSSIDQANANTPVSGAAFTTVNEGVDGTGHCQNGNPNTNCNIYDGKQYVWLNGGPSVAYVGDGSYFFAVLDPGGQADPNDGAAKNLSDDVDAYTNRTFSVSAGTVSYGGSHDFASNKIRLADYADTSNPGGVYILAICSLADGYPAKASDCKYDAFKINSGQEVPPASEVTVTKDAAGAYDTTWTWGITKDVDKTTVKQIGGSATFNYTVKVTHDSGTNSNVVVTGTIDVENPNFDESFNTVPVTISSLTDQLSDGTLCPIDTSAGLTLTAFDNYFTYSCSLSAVPQGELDNTVTATWDNQLLENGTLLDTGTADFTFTSVSFDQTKIDDCVNVTDSYAGTLGLACQSDASPKSFTYSRSIPVPANGCLSYGNTATFTTNTTGTTGSASQTVNVCGPAKTSALTIGFWKNTNGNTLIQYYCAPGGKTSLASYLSTLGGASGPFKDAAGSCSQLVTYVNNVIKGANSTNMNVMLRAQMLATALDVYFSDPNLGYTATSVSKTKPPSTFLLNGSLGGFTMDMTAICPMVDNTTAGTATCTSGKPSTDGFASGAFPAASMTIQALLTYEATAPVPFNGSVSNPTWYGGDRTKETIAKNAFDQINNQDAFAG